MAGMRTSIAVGTTTFIMGLFCTPSISAILATILTFVFLWTNANVRVGFHLPINRYKPLRSLIASSTNNDKTITTRVLSKGRTTASLTKPPRDGEEYWFREDIHTLGNTGFLGGLHAAMAPLSTRAIDHLAYNGINVRETIAKQLSEHFLSPNPVASSNTNRATTHQLDNDDDLRILDMGCGVGMSTASIALAFRLQTINTATTNAGDAAASSRVNIQVVGVDTSPEMLAMARTKDLERKGITKLVESQKASCPRNRNENHGKSASSLKENLTNDIGIVGTEFVLSNAEVTPFPSKSFDLVTIMFVLHEVPLEGRQKILREAQRLLKRGGILSIVDISPDYTPNPSMLSGEPYLQDFQQKFEGQVQSMKGFESLKAEVVVPGHVVHYSLLKSVKSDGSWWKNWFARFSRTSFLAFYTTGTSDGFSISQQQQHE